MTYLLQPCSCFQNLRIETLFLIKEQIMEDLQDVGKSSDDKQRFTICRTILIIKDKTSTIWLEIFLIHK